MSELLTGGSGRLGTELQKYQDFIAPTHEEMDITTDFTKYSADLIIHGAAYTNVDKAETDQEECFKVNVEGTARLVEAYKDIPFVYISTEHAFKPINTYSDSKLAAEGIVRAIHPHHLIIRTLFKPRPWLYDNAWTDQMTRGDYTDVIAKLILKEVNDWDKITSKTVLVGTERKSIYDLAKQTRPDVLPSSRLDHPGAAERPADYE